MSSTTTTTTTTTTTLPTPTQEQPSYLSLLQRDGFVVIPSLLSPTELSRLRDASHHATQLTREGKWPYYRTVPKQFPPWPQGVASPSGTGGPPTAAEGGVWGVQHLLHPDMPGREVFAGLYFSREVLGVVEEVLGLSSSSQPAGDERKLGDEEGKKEKGKKEKELGDNLVLELFNLLVSPTTTDFRLTWHRDDVPPTLSPSEELSQLQLKSPEGRQFHTQYNIALTPDSSLTVIPGSHLRARTDIERSADPYEASLPDMLNVKLEAGDAVFYDSNILHRGTYQGITPEELKGGETGRLTLHGSVGLVGHGEERARAVLQHGVGMWIGREDACFTFGEGEGKGEGESEDRGVMERRAEEMRGRLMEMGRGEGVGYSLEG